MIRFLIIFLLSTPATAQFLSNPSFEGTRQANIPPMPWTPCNEYSTPDTQPSFWGVNAVASHKDTYISLFTRGIGGFLNDGITEAIGAPLAKSLKKDSCYVFSIDLSFFPKATFTGSWGEFVEYKSPSKLRLWGGSSACDKNTLLYESPIISHEAWKTYSFPVTPAKDLTHIILEASYVDGRIEFGCLLLDNIRIEQLTVNLGPDQSICTEGGLTLNASGEGRTYLWNTGSKEPSISVEQSGNYSVVISKNGCSANDNVTIAYTQPLAVELGPEITLCDGENVTLNAGSSGAIYLWSTGSTSNSIVAGANGVYKVRVSNECETVEDEVEVKVVENYCCNLYAPNVFTPNADGLNDTFEITSPSTLDQYRLRIYNRWGDLVFEGSEIANHWAGTTNTGQLAASGIYYWIAAIDCGRNDLQYSNSYRGTVTLLR